MQIIKNTTLNIQAIVEPGANRTVKNYNWFLDGIDLQHNSYTLALDTTPLEIGLHVVLFKATNSCGSAGDAQLQFDLIEVNKMEKTVNIVVDQPIVLVTIVLNYTGAADVTVTNGVNPVAGATLDVDDIPTGISTGVDGKASIPNIPYGAHTLKATKV